MEIPDARIALLRVSCMEMTWLLIHMKYQYARSMLRLLHGNDIVINL